MQRRKSVCNFHVPGPPMVQPHTHRVEVSNPFSAVLIVRQILWRNVPTKNQSGWGMTNERMLTHARPWCTDQGNTVQPHTPRQLAAWKQNAKQEGAAKVREFQVLGGWCSAWESPELSLGEHIGGIANGWTWMGR